MRTRVISSVVGVALLVAVFLLYSRYSFVLNLVVAAAGALAAFEFLSATGGKKHFPLLLASLLFAGGVPCLLLLRDNVTFTITAAAFTYVFFSFSYMILHHNRINYGDVTSILAIVLLITASLSTLALLGVGQGSKGVFYIVLTLAAAWTADIGAYLAGTFFGKRKLIPEVSPKKTVEGAIGGFMFDVLCLIILGLVARFLFPGEELRVSYLSLALIGIAGTFLSMIGDLTFSLIKRTHDIKDYGKIMPGHGGILDRIDSLIFVAPAVYILITVFPVLG